MGTWADGPFDNDHALDYASSVTAGLRKTIDAFVRRRSVDTFDAALAAVALLNRITAASDVMSPFSRDEARERWHVMIDFYKSKVGPQPDPGPFGDPRIYFVGRELERFVRESFDVTTVLDPPAKKASAKKASAKKASAKKASAKKAPTKKPARR